LVTEPALLLADEPTGNLDSSSTADVLSLLSELHDEGRTIVLITHEADVARQASRTIQIFDGQVREGEHPLMAVARWSGATPCGPPATRCGPTGCGRCSRCSASSSASAR